MLCGLFLRCSGFLFKAVTAAAAGDADTALASRHPDRGLAAGALIELVLLPVPDVVPISAKKCGEASLNGQKPEILPLPGREIPGKRAPIAPEKSRNGDPVDRRSHTAIKQSPQQQRQHQQNTYHNGQKPGQVIHTVTPRHEAA